VDEEVANKKKKGDEEEKKRLTHGSSKNFLPRGTWAVASQIGQSGQTSKEKKKFPGQ